MEQTKIKRFLWVVPSWPFPPRDGASIARANLIESLAHQGYSIDILLISNAQDSSFELPKNVTIGSIHPVKTSSEKKNKLKLLYYFIMSFIKFRTPAVMLRFSSHRVRKAVSKILQENPSKWDAIVYDGLHMAAHQINAGRFIKPEYPKIVIYRSHNVESDIWFRMAIQQINPFKKWLLQSQAKRIARFEQSMLSKADGVATVSITDYTKLKELEPNMKGNVVPISFDFKEPLQFPQSNDSIQIMFLGRLDWDPNKEGLIWFLKEVWPEVINSHKNIYLNIAGSGDSSWLHHYLKLANVNFLGRIDSIEPLYQSSCLVIVPIFFGSGTRVKIIEACLYGRPCLSTTVGAEGIGLEDQTSYYCANDAANWIKCLNNIQLARLKEMGQNAFHHAQKTFGHDTARNEFIKLL